MAFNGTVFDFIVKCPVGIATTTTTSTTTTTTTAAPTTTTTTSTTTSTTTAVPYNVTIYSRAGDIVVADEYNLYYSQDNFNWTLVAGPLSSTSCTMHSTVGISSGTIYIKAQRDSDAKQIYLRGANSSTCPANLNVECTYSATITGTESVAVTIYVDGLTNDFLDC